ncbi:PREDICTED: ADP-ribosylation factor GTPase-activating protein effector protein 2 [Erythranthe guttata]|nr:PREDICTED: ADP-ribosylation factor GTPase-activating protein effector protein 2 [Erythranthe guttata]|eukprot:XP_012855776.1 PREDICTED: ADP-ribosylation factor GTPase-activating protein effector protein 2 [Erythranthe guttata]
MPRRVKEEEKIEMIIRDLLKQTDNRRCINCNSLGPQYVCTTFWTFVCTNCSGVHREFTHRVKSVSMAKFNEEEITSLQAGGNEETSKNYCEIRPFEKRREDFITERPTFERNSSFEKYIPSIRTNARTFKDILEERSPRYSSSSSSRNNRTPRNFEVVDDRFRDDGSVKRYEIVRHSSYNNRDQPQRSASMTSSTLQKVPVLTICGPPKSNATKETSDSAKVQVAEATNKEDFTDEKRKTEKTVNLNSLIDFDPKIETSSNTASKNDNEKSSATQVASNATNNNTNLLECLLLDWSSPVNSPSKGADVATVKEAEKNDRPMDNNNSRDLVVQEPNKSHALSDITPVQSFQIEQPSQASDPSNARKEIPQDLFSVADWPMHPPNYGSGYGYQFHPPAMPVAGFPNPVKPHNPFDIGDDRFQIQASTFHSMPPVQGSMPNIPPSTYGMNMNMHLVPGAYIGHLPSNMPLTRPQGISDFGRSEMTFSPLNHQAIAGTEYSSPASHSSSVSRAGNPFG